MINVTYLFTPGLRQSSIQKDSEQVTRRARYVIWYRTVPRLSSPHDVGSRGCYANQQARGPDEVLRRRSLGNSYNCSSVCKTSRFLFA
jgi:hypothetical protein